MRTLTYLEFLSAYSLFSNENRLYALNMQHYTVTYRYICP